MSEPSILAGKKIVVLIHSFARGGCERQAFLVTRQLRRQLGLDAQVWALFGAVGNPGDYRQEFENAGIPTKVLRFESPRYGWVQRCLPILRELRRTQVRVLLPFTTWPNVVAGLTYRLAGVTVCIWGERSAGTERIPGIERVAVKQYRRFVANSSAGIDFLVQEMKVPQQRVSFVPNCVELSETDPASNWRVRLGLCPDQLLVIKIANLTGFKDHATLLRAWKMVQDAWKGPHRPRLALAGRYDDTDIFGECQRIIREGEIESTVDFLGSVTDVPGLISACDLAVFSSPKEGMPNGVLECMAGSKAIIVSDLPGVRDALGPDGDEMVVPSGDVVAFANRLLWFLRNDARRRELGRINFNRIRSEFSVEKVVQRHLKIIESNCPAAWREKSANSVRQRKPREAAEERA